MQALCYCSFFFVYESCNSIFIGNTPMLSDQACHCLHSHYKAHLFALYKACLTMWFSIFLFSFPKWTCITIISGKVQLLPPTIHLSFIHALTIPATTLHFMFTSLRRSRLLSSLQACTREYGHPFHWMFKCLIGNHYRCLVLSSCTNIPADVDDKHNWILRNFTSGFVRPSTILAFTVWERYKINYIQWVTTTAL